jgi:hypothetical protein
MTLAEKWEEAHRISDALPHHKRALIHRMDDHVLLIMFNRDGCRARAVKRAFFRGEGEESWALKDCVDELIRVSKEKTDE